MKKLAESVMTSNLITIDREQPISKAHEIMKNRRLRHLPVIDEQGNIIGILSDRDVQRAMTSTINIGDGASNPEEGLCRESNEFRKDARVHHYMSWPVKSVYCKTDLREVAGQMVVDKLSSLLVLDSHSHRPLGIITTEDILKVFMGFLEHSSNFQRLNV